MGALWSRLRVPGLDARAIGAFRIVVGLNVIYNVLKYRLFYVEGFHTQKSILPEVVVNRMYGDHFSVLDYLGSNWMVAAFFVLMLVLGGLYTVGFKPRVMGVLCLLCLWSIMHKNPFTTHGVETFLDVCLFWGTFLPLNAAFTLFPSSETQRTGEIRNLAVYAMLFQVALIYFTGGVTKNGPMWQDGVALHISMGDRTFAGLIAGFLAGQPGLCKFFSYAAVITEAAIALLIFLPLLNRPARVLASVSIMALHILIALSLNVGPFYLITTAFAVLILPGLVWDRLGLSGRLPFARPAKSKPRWSLPAAPARYLRIAVQVLIVFMMAFVFQKNLQKWWQASYLSGVIDATPVLDRIAAIETPRVGLSGTFTQPWWLFAPDPNRQMGTILIAGITPDRQIIDLLTGKPLMEVDHDARQMKIIGEPRNHFAGTRFVFSWYVRRYFRVLPDEVFRDLAAYEFRRWRKWNRGTRLQEVSVVLWSNDTTWDGSEVKRETATLILGSYIPEPGE